MSGSSASSQSHYSERGVKKLFIVGIAYNLTENYENVKNLLEPLNLKALSNFIIAADLKLCNIITGLQIILPNILVLGVRQKNLLRLKRN